VVTSPPDVERDDVNPVTSPWQPPEWHVTIDRPLPMLPPYEPAIRWLEDARDFLLTAVFVVLTGPIVGLVWAAVGPKVGLIPALQGSASGWRPEIGADFHFGLLGAGAGLVCAAIAVAWRRDGPGVPVGLAIGGLGAAVVADRVAFLVNRPDTLDTLRRHGVPLSLLAKYGIDPFFKVRALGVLVAWPVAALVAYAIALAVMGRNRSLP
jgi:hypothetical protein